MKIAITTDSGSGISQQEAKRLGITVIPMPFMIDNETYFEGINILVAFLALVSQHYLWQVKLMKREFRLLIIERLR